MNRIILGLIIAIAIGGGIVVFSNIDELVSPNIEQVSNQISDNLQETTSEIKFTNPLKIYEIDSKCKLAYLIQDNIKNNQGYPFKADKNYVETTIRQEWEEDAKKMNEEFEEEMRFDPDIMEQKSLEFIELGKQKMLDHIMEYNSIHPKLRNSVSLVSDYFITVNDPSQQMILLDTMSLIKPESYQEDPECGKLFHERFGEETFNVFKSLYGEEQGQKKYAELKDVIYGN